MSWPRFSLQHRYTVFAALIAVVILGIDARFTLPIELFPDTDPPVVTVITNYPGVAAADVAKNLSKPLEEEFAGIDGVARITSTSQVGVSVVKAEFHYTRAVAEAAMDVQNAISRIRSRLPGTISEPQVLQFSSSDKPIVTLALRGRGLELPEVRELADNPVRDRLQLVEGVATVDVFGGYKDQLEVAVHLDRLRAYSLDLDQVANTLARWNLTESGGRIDHGALETVVRFDMPLQGADDVGHLIVSRTGDRVVRLGDIADVRVEPAEPRSAYRFNGAPALAVQILKRDEANTVDVVQRLRAAVDSLERDFPELEFQIADDDAAFTELVIDTMTSSVLIAIVLTIVVVSLFLGSAVQAAIIAISIPVSFLMTFALMSLAGLTLDMVTMSAIILSIGLLVDDGIVVLENVERHMTEEGKTPARAAIDGTEEIFLADLAGTATTIAVLIPLMFLGGFVGKLFGPLAMTLAFALSSSFIVSVTLIPLLTALWLRPTTAPGILARSVRPFNALMAAVLDGYLRLLRVAMARPLVTIGVVIVLLVGSARLMVFLGSEMLPRFDSGTFTVNLDTIPGTRLEETLGAIEETEKYLLDQPGVIGVSTQLGYEPGGHYLGSRGAMDVNQAEITVNLTPRTERESDIWMIMDQARAAFSKIPGVTLFILKEKGGTARSTTASSIDVRLSGPNPDVLNRLGDQVLARIKGVVGIRDAYKNWAMDTPEINVVLDRGRVAELGLDGKAVADEVYEAVEGRAVTPFRQLRYRDLDIFLRYAENDRRRFDSLEDIHLLAPDGASIPLRELASFEDGIGPRIVTREDLRQTLDVLASHYGRPLSEVIADIETAVAEVVVPADYELAITGEQRDFTEARTRILRALAIGVLALYLVLVAQFRSFKHPVTIMMAVPLQFIGAGTALLLAGKYVSMPALLGVILLAGTVVNNSIVLIDYILQRQRGGIPLKEAILDSVATRFRPIMMTALSDVAGMMPLALELAVGAERFSPIATVVIGGVLAATLLTLVVIPVLFVLFERASERLGLVAHGIDDQMG